MSGTLVAIVLVTENRLGWRTGRPEWEEGQSIVGSCRRIRQADTSKGPKRLANSATPIPLTNCDDK